MTITNEKACWRHEYKYICNAMQNEILKAKAEGLMSRDGHAGENGVYRVRSLYLDDPYNRCYQENENGTDRRAKYRIRIYNEEAGYISLEKKMKYRGMTRKIACGISEELCRTFMEGGLPELKTQKGRNADSGTDEKLLALLTEIRSLVLRPAVIVEYERRPFVEENGNVRITFDRDISSSHDFTSFLEPAIAARPIMPPGTGIMEVKWDSHLPSYLRRHMELDTIRWSTFSKYYLCRKYNCHGGSVL